MSVTEERGSRPVTCGDGYDYLEFIEKSGWTSIGSWGRDGWDLGSWPLISFSVRKSPRSTDTRPLFDVVEHVEGDLTYLRNATKEQRDAWLDIKAVWFWLSGQTSARDLRTELTAGLAEHLRREHGVDPTSEYATAMWDQHVVLHDVRQSDPVLLDGWVPDYCRGPFSWKRLEAEKAS